MNIVEIKIEKAGVVVFQGFKSVDDQASVVSYAKAVIESTTKYKFEEEDFAAITDLCVNYELTSRFGAEWEYDIQAVVLSMDECDIDEEFDSVHDKYSFCL